MPRMYVVSSFLQQAMLETGWLSFGGDAESTSSISQGLGTTGGGVKGIAFQM